MKTIIFILFFSLFAFVNYAQDYFKVTGIVLDSRTKSTLPFVSVYLSGSKYCGTVSNETGEFILKIPKNTKADSLKISFLGYRTTSISLRDLNSDKNLNKIELQESSIILNEVIAKPINAEELIETAIQKIPENYDIKPIMMNGFYREIQQISPLDFKTKEFTDDHYENEAIFDIYRSPYRDKSTKEADDDYIKLIAWRKKGEVKDSLFKEALGNLKGTGPNNILNSDPLKDIKSSFLWKKNREDYIFVLKDITTYDNNRVYVIEFDQADYADEQLYKGTIYIDMASMAFVEIDYMLSPKGAKYNSLHKTMFIGLKLNQESEKIVYKKYNDKWNLYFIQSALSLDMTIYNTFLTKSWFKKEWPDREDITLSINRKHHFVITNVEKINIVKFSSNELFESSTELKDEKNKDRDDIWGKYNFIKMP